MCIELKLCVYNVNLNVYRPGWERRAVAIACHPTHDILKKLYVTQLKHWILCFQHICRIHSFFTPLIKGALSGFQFIFRKRVS